MLLFGMVTSHFVLWFKRLGNVCVIIGLECERDIVRLLLFEVFFLLFYLKFLAIDY